MTLRDLLEEIEVKEAINLSEGFNSKEPLKASRGAIDYILNEIYKYRQDHKLSDEDFINGMKYVLKTLFPSFDAEEYEKAREEVSAPTSKKEANKALRKLNHHKYFGKDGRDSLYIPTISIIKEHYNKNSNSKYRAGISHVMSHIYGNDWLTNKNWTYNIPPEKVRKTLNGVPRLEKPEPTIKFLQW